MAASNAGLSLEDLMHKFALVLSEYSNKMPNRSETWGLTDGLSSNMGIYGKVNLFRSGHGAGHARRACNSTPVDCFFLVAAALSKSNKFAGRQNTHQAENSAGVPVGAVQVATRIWTRLTSTEAAVLT